LGGQVAPEEVRKQALEKNKKPEGWTNKLGVGATGTFNHSDGVVGTEDGATVQMGLVLDASAELVKRRNEWLTAIKIVHTQSREPVLDRFLKSADSLDFATTYLLRLQEITWVGPYARARLSTQLFDGYLYKATPGTVLRTTEGGTKSQQDFAARQRVDLSGAFEPLLAMASAGFFANPVETKEFTAKTKLGAGVQQILSRGGYTVDDKKDTPQIELVQLRTSTQAGAELELALQGEVNTNTAWQVSSNFFVPLYSTGKEALLFDGMSTVVGAGLKVRLSKWASFDYTLSAKNIPTVVDRWQLQNGMLLTMAWTVL